MNCRFENISVQSRENLLEMYRRTLRKSFAVYGAAVLVLFLIFLVSGFLTQSFSIVYTGMYVVMVIIIGNWVIRMPKKSAKTVYERNQEQFQCEPQTHIFFYDSEMRGRNLQTGVEIQVPYDQIVMVMETKHLFLIRIPEKRMVLVDKNGFQRGSSSDFEAFLKEKCTSASFS